MKILVINPGSTSTKLAIYDGTTQKWCHTIRHSVEELSHFAHINDQLPYRTALMHKALSEAGIPVEFDAVIARGGLLQPTPGGVYEIDSNMIHDLIHAPMEHACNLGALMAHDIASECHVPSFIADPEVVDELMPEARMSGLPQLPRHSVFHALNIKAVARHYAHSIHKPYESLNLIMVHLGGGISVGAHRKGKVIDVNNALDGDGPFSPERAGTVPAGQLVDLCFSGEYTHKQLKRLLNGKGGLTAHLGTNDVEMITSRAQAGEEPYKSVLDSMLYTVAKEVGARSVALRGQVDAIILTGGIAHSQYCVEKLSEWISHIAPIVVRAGEDELKSLALNAYGALTGQLPICHYAPDHLL